jgi:nucleoid DNA-binding protein
MTVAKKKAAPAKTTAKKPKALTVDKPMTKTEMIKTMVEATDLKKSQVVALLDVYAQIIEAHVGKKGPGSFTMPGLFKIEIVKKAATKARKGRNPFTGEEMVFKAKPACKKVKIKALKQLKDLAN